MNRFGIEANINPKTGAARPEWLRQQQEAEEKSRLRRQKARAEARRASE